MSYVCGLADGLAAVGGPNLVWITDLYEERCQQTIRDVLRWPTS